MARPGLGTRCVQAGYSPKNGEPRQIPIIQSTTFKYESSAEMGKLFDLEASGYFYSRLQNPTNDAVAARIAALEGGTAAMLTGSGMSAIFFSVFNIVGAGDHLVSSSSIYGGSFNLFSVTMKRMGVEVTFVDPDCSPEELDAAFRPNTKAMYGETIANPALTVLDIEKFAAAAVSPDVDAINVECYIHSEDDLPEPEPEEDEEDDGTADSDEDDAQGVIDRILNTWTNAGSNP